MMDKLSQDVIRIQVVHSSMSYFFVPLMQSVVPISFVKMTPFRNADAMQSKKWLVSIHLV